MNSTYPNFASLARCSKPIPISVATLGHRLSVRKPSTFPGLKKDDYPAVARWDFDAASGVQYIGVKCGAAWCEVGPKGFTPSPAAFADDPSQSAKWRRVRLVKGWYDRQLLAVPGQDAFGHEIAVPSGIDGIIMPDERLDDLNLFDPYRDHMIHTATMILRSTPLASTDLAKYRTIFGIPAGVTLPITLEVSLCYGSPVSCTLPPGAPAPCIAEGTGDDNPAFDVTPPPHDPARRWFSLVQGPGFKVARCIRRFSNFDPATGGPFRTTGTTRWRWKANDEGGWMRCAPGCCEQL